MKFPEGSLVRVTKIVDGEGNPVDAGHGYCKFIGMTGTVVRHEEDGEWYTVDMAGGKHNGQNFRPEELDFLEMENV